MIYEIFTGHKLLLLRLSVGQAWNAETICEVEVSRASPETQKKHQTCGLQFLILWRRKSEQEERTPKQTYEVSCRPLNACMPAMCSCRDSCFVRCDDFLQVSNGVEEL